jgi:DNA-binding GntR family transcriptional regulator
MLLRPAMGGCQVTASSSDELIASLFASPARPLVASTAERVVDVLRSYLIEGRLQPGTRLSEEALAAGLNVSRNTLREAFRILAHEKLVVHEMNRGVFVRALTSTDVGSIYQLRELIETAAARTAPLAGAAAISRVRLAVTEGLMAAEREDWRGLGTANMHFHLAVAGLLGNSRIDGVMSQLLAELRLAFHVMTPLKDFHFPYLGDNQRICRLIEDGAGEEAALALHDYLARAQMQLERAFVAGTAPGEPAASQTIHSEDDRRR